MGFFASCVIAFGAVVSSFFIGLGISSGKDKENAIRIAKMTPTERKKLETLLKLEDDE